MSQPTHPRDVHEYSRFSVETSDVLSDMRVNVMAEGAERVIWYKERFLADEEIIEHLVENATSTILWSIHRPKRGWYIRLCSPSFPTGTFIPLIPLPQTSPFYADAALSFACRTNPPSYSLSNSPDQRFTITRDSIDSDVTVTDSPRNSAVHSYPPTPPRQTPAVIVSPPSPRSINAKLEEVEIVVAASSSSAPEPPPAQRPPRTPLAPITHFLLTPHSTPHVPQPTQSVSIFARVMSALKNNAPSHAYSFTLSPIPSPNPSPSSSAARDGSIPAIPTIPADPTPTTPVPLLTFHDRTPVWTVRSNSGTLEIDKTQVRTLGVDISFYIAVALTYLEFLSERESYLAALND
ncbi:hypothetical protein WOLCODRAFT_132585 [Wolfiporia cocos MD-104 SS10]|uniref:Uncharacterized protein n=1 Tax=Wolfiporia cocos (strain MD-104) TaxID=742152 RepID=A0A2H3JL84_WOLCO|nr:hypothetical protein WOLCODRAFT_132585 [Wolfiporia cocos MD-104 SS10]